MHQAYRYYSYAYQRVRKTPAAPFILFKRVYTVEEEKIFIKELKNILINYPKFPFIDAVRFELSLFLYLNNLLNDAIYYADQIIRDKDSQFLPYALTLKASVYLKKEDCEDAIYYFFESISSLKSIIYDNKYEQQLMNNYIGLAICYFKNVDFKTSEMIFKKIYGTSNIKNVKERALYYLYKLYLESNRFDLAGICFSIFNQAFPKSLYLNIMKEENDKLSNSFKQYNSSDYWSIGIRDESILKGIDNLNSLISLNISHEDLSINDVQNNLSIGFSIQIGSFTSEENAKRAKEKVMKYHYPVYIQKVGNDKKYFFRVRIGPFNTRNEATDILEKLKKYGIDGYVVKEEK